MFHRLVALCRYVSGTGYFGTSLVLLASLVLASRKALDACRLKQVFLQYLYLLVFADHLDYYFL